MLAIIRAIQLFWLAMMVSKLSLHLPDPTIAALEDYLKIAPSRIFPRWTTGKVQSHHIGIGCQTSCQIYQFRTMGHQQSQEISRFKPNHHLALVIRPLSLPVAAYSIGNASSGQQGEAAISDFRFCRDTHNHRTAELQARERRR